MKNSLISRICRLTTICLFVLSMTAYLRAQQPQLLTPSVKAEALKRLDDARNFQVSKPDSGDGNYRKMVLRDCNQGPKNGDMFTKSDACDHIASDYSFGHKFTALDDLMPLFKACSVSDGDDDGCSMLVSALIEGGHPDYALVIAVYAPNCHKLCRQSVSFVMDSAGNAQLTVSPHYGGKLELNNRFDVLQLLERGCHGDGKEEECQHYAQLGGQYSEAERQQGIEATQEAEERSTANSQAQSNRANSPGFMSTLAGALTNAQQATPTIQETAAQNQANLQVAATAAQQRQQDQEQARIAAVQSARVAQTTATNAPYIPSDINASPSSVQGSCTDMTGLVQGTVRVGSDGWVSGYLTNNSNQALYVSYTFKQNGVPSDAMANAGGTTIQGGQTVGGEGQGLYSTGADKNPPEIYWYAVLKSEHDKYGCAHKW